jgi:hypothetical protein
MKELAAVLRSEVDRAAGRFQAWSEADVTRERGEGKWVRKEILGHLIDSAFNNQQRFVRAQLGPSLTFPGYTQDAWVAAQAYQERSWEDILTLWAEVNRHLAHVITHIQRHALVTPCTIGQGAPVTLRFVAEDYVRHLHHHLAQVIRPEAAEGKTHLPYA